MKKIFLLISTIFIVFFLVEIGLRLFYSKKSKFPQISSIKPFSPIQSDSVLGYTLKAGEFHFMYDQNYSFKSTHNKDGWRITSEDEFIGDRSIFIYGGSLFYGFGLNDSCTFPWKLQEELTSEDISVRNYSVFAYSPTSTLLLLKKQIARGEKPDMAVFTYATYNNARVVFTKQFSNTLYNNRSKFSDGVKYPYYRFNNDSLKLMYKEIKASSISYIQETEISKLLSKLLYKTDEKKYRSEEIHELIMMEMIDICKSYNIQPVIFNVSCEAVNSPSTQMFQSKEVPVISTSVNYMDTSFNLMPFDNHPNDFATDVYTKEFVDLLIDLCWIRNTGG